MVADGGVAPLRNRPPAPWSKLRRAVGSVSIVDFIAASMASFRETATRQFLSFFHHFLRLGGGGGGMAFDVSLEGEADIFEPGGDIARVEPGGTERVAPEGRAGAMYRPPALAFSMAAALSTGSLMALKAVASTMSCEIHNQPR